ncbi:MAG: Fic family protein [Algoriphagus sp.]|uniref:Fic family protein n=1 Tax=Algoriphagus sp. TaxID=1872435 RepID=UPI0027308711|nr:Fic family protein [Algoriphagus sp.]MDP2039808.1 Fic family protein [Algoriphagus sp.]MDP3472623.1 Fic family protein [Algoriphagus sp.]
MSYNWQQKGWPEFQFSPGILDGFQVKFLLKSGKVSGQFAGISEDQKEQYLVETLLSEAIKTSAIEGEFLSRVDVMSSLKKNLGIHEEQPRLVKDHRAKGIAKLMVAVRQTWKAPLSDTMLFSWHEMLMEGNRYVQAGAWRKGSEPMQVVSGALGKEIVHFEAPPSEQVPDEMNRFIAWFNATNPEGEKAIRNPILRAALVHLYFESIHPFEDGNGRIGRVLAEKALHQGLDQPILISLSQVIEANRQLYYDKLKQEQRSLQVDDWLLYFANVVMKAQEKVEELIEFSLQKTRFFDSYSNELNEREMKALNRMLDEGPDGFEGGMNAKKYSSLTGASKATATRDLQHLRGLGIFLAEGGGRSVRYQVKLA